LVVAKSDKPGRAYRLDLQKSPNTWSTVVSLNLSIKIMGSTASTERSTESETPARPEPGELDWEKCANLHNRILDIGWAAVGGHRQQKSWWEHYFGEGSKANSML
jgi:hypothetical protein